MRGFAGARHRFAGEPSVDQMKSFLGKTGEQERVQILDILVGERVAVSDEHHRLTVLEIKLSRRGRPAVRARPQEEDQHPPSFASLHEESLTSFGRVPMTNSGKSRSGRQRSFYTTLLHVQLNRESLYRQLSRRGNPSLASLNAVLNALGLKLRFST